MHRPPIVKKKRHIKKLSGIKEKRPRKDPLPNSEETPANTCTGTENDPTTAPKDPVVITPEILNAIKLSLKDDLLQIYQQACQQALDNQDSQSSTSSISESPMPTRPPLLHPPPQINPSKRGSNQDNRGKRPWLTKAARKHIMQQPPTCHSDNEDEGSPEREDDQDDDEDQDSEPFSSTEDQDQEDQEDNIARFFDSEDYQHLLSKCLSALDLKDTLKKEGSAGTSRSNVHPKNTLWGSGNYFPKKTSMEKVFSFPIFFEQQLRAEWESPAITKRSLPSVRKLYSLPKFTDDFLKVPPMDAPIVDLQSSGLLLQDGQGSIRDTWDKEIKQDLRGAYEASALAIKSTATASIAARATIVWGKKLLDLFPQMDSCLLEGPSRILEATPSLLMLSWTILCSRPDPWQPGNTPSELCG